MNGGDESTGDESTTAPLQFYTKNLIENTSLTITGNSGNDIGLTNKEGTSRNVESTLGFHLAGVDIPHPNNHMCEGTTCGQTRSYQNLCWIPRCTTAGKVAFVLGLVNGACPPTAGITCSASETTSYTWQLSTERQWTNGGDTDVAAEECSEENSRFATCEACCNYQSNSQENIPDLGSSCSTKGESKVVRIFFLGEDTRITGKNGLDCHCSGYYPILICQ